MKFVTQTLLGRRFGMSAIKVGKILKQFNYRLPNGEPSSLAWNEGIVEERYLEEKPEIPFWVWDEDRTAEILQDAGLKEVSL